MWSYKDPPKGNNKRTFDNIREKATAVCAYCTQIGRNNKHPESKCWDLYPEKKPMKFRVKKAKTEDSTAPANLSVTDSYSLTCV